MKNKNLKRSSDNMNTAIERYCSVSQSLEESLQQMKLMREGKLPKKTWNEVYAERKRNKDIKDD